MACKGREFMWFSKQGGCNAEGMDQNLLGGPRSSLFLGTKSCWCHAEHALIPLPYKHARLHSTRYISYAMRCDTAGTIALSAQLAESLEALYNARIPRDWLAKSWEASTLGSWFAGLLARHDQLSRWLNSGRPKAYWLTGFFNPQVCFLTTPRTLLTRVLYLSQVDVLPPDEQPGFEATYLRALRGRGRAARPRFFLLQRGPWKRGVQLGV